MKYSLALLLSFYATILFGQTEIAKPEFKFGDVKPEDFAPKYYPIDSQANAVILFDIGKAKYDIDKRGGLQIIYEFHKRVRLMNKNSYDEATVEIPVYTGYYEEKIESLEAVTYHLEGNTVVKTPLEKSAIYKDKATKNFYIQKFTFPNLKEGCIIEYTYKFISPFEQNLKGWYFQDNNYPILWSQYETYVPQLYNFLPVKKGFQNYVINSVDKKFASYNIRIAGESAMETSDIVSYSGNDIHRVYAMKDVPAIKKEAFTTTISNYISKLEFYLLSIDVPGQPSRPRIRSWMQTADLLLKDESFGAPLFEDNNWLESEVTKAMANGATDFEKAKNIFDYVRTNFTCTDDEGLVLSQPLKKIFQAKKGTVADINLLLTAMYIKAGFEAHPIMLSTRDHGKPMESYPVLSQFNYVICRVHILETPYLVDASEKKIGFTKLPFKCYNGSARIIDRMPYLVDLSPESLTTSRNTAFFIVNTEDNKSMMASCQKTLDYYESVNVRNTLSTKSKDEFFKDIKKEYWEGVEVSNGEFESLDNLDTTLSYKYDFTFGKDEETIYFNPMLTEAKKSNPFTAAVRSYPVEMTGKLNETVIVNMEVPNGYTIDELPKSARVTLNEDEGMFEYIVVKSGNNIQFRSKIVINKANFAPEDYETIRNFYAYIVKKHSEQIVFKKIKQ